jgi:hypothetical protein
MSEQPTSTAARICPLYRSALIGSLLGEPVPGMDHYVRTDYRTDEVSLVFESFAQVMACDAEACGWWQSGGCGAASQSQSSCACR